MSDEALSQEPDMIAVRCINPRCKRKHWAVWTQYKGEGAGYVAQCTFDGYEDIYSIHDAIEDVPNA